MPIDFHSEKIGKPNKHLGTYQKELWAIKQCLTKWRYLLQGVNFHVMTDHKPLESMFKTVNKNETEREKRWKIYISELTTDIRHVKGKENVVADYMSRLLYEDGIAAIAAMAEPRAEPDQRAKMIHEHQEKDRIIEQRSAKWRLKQKGLDKDGRIVDIRTFHGYPLACDIASARDRPLIPESASETICNDMHSTTHPGVKTTTKLVKHYFVVPNVAKKARRTVDECEACQKTKPAQRSELPEANSRRAQSDFDTYTSTLWESYLSRSATDGC